MGEYDIPAIINYIQKTTKSNKKITFIGHSQGNTQLFAGLTLLPEFYKKKLNGFLALGPITYMKNINSTFLKYLVELHLDQLISKLGFSEIFRNTQMMINSEKFFCTELKIFCKGVLEIIADFNSIDDDLDRLIVLLSHFPSGTSVKSFSHFAQALEIKTFLLMEI